MKNYLFTAIATVSFLTACGGGGGGDSAPVTSTATFNLDAAFANFQTSAHNFNLSGSASGTSLSLSYSTTPLADGTLSDGTKYKQSQSTQTIKNASTGGVLLTSTTTKAFSVNPYTPIVALTSPSGLATVPKPISAPTSATIGQSGSLGAYTIYSDSTLSTVSYTGSSTWTLQQGTNSSNAYLCTNSVYSNNTSFSECWLIDSGNNTVGVKLTTKDASGGTITYQ